MNKNFPDFRIHRFIKIWRRESQKLEFEQLCFFVSVVYLDKQNFYLIFSITPRCQNNT